MHCCIMAMCSLKAPIHKADIGTFHTIPRHLATFFFLNRNVYYEKGCKREHHYNGTAHTFWYFPNKSIYT